MSATTFSELADALGNAGAACGAAESHGTLCGAICAGVDGEDTWLEHILDQAEGPDDAQRECRRELASLCDTTRAALMSGALEFEPLLPGDEAGLAERTAALGEWCQGFLFGMGLGGGQPALEQMPDEAGEVLRDMGQIAQAGFEGEAAGAEDDEVAYTEIVEYLRVGVQLLYDELQPPPQGNAPGSAALH